ncbi:hypothetical protein MPSEU_000737800 [Mayamaea pseudoterrestris]|nr:hypothetical protein MPSEU_000737800 [Mayamaea pseudoterrestris]
MPRGRESDDATSEAVVEMSDTTALPVAAGDTPVETPMSKSVELEDGAVSFPHKLHEILSDESNNDIIAWLPNGKGFQIVNKKRFAAETLPRYFSKKSKFTSFTRKLNRWNFIRVTRGAESGAYYHAQFQRDDPKMVSQMTCINSKSPQQLQPMDPVALGLATPSGGQYQWPTDPAEQARAGQYWQQWMHWFQSQQKDKKEGEEGALEDVTKTDDGEDKKPSAEGEAPQDMQAMMAAWQYYQYYSMSLWQQQQQNPPNSPFPPPPASATATAAAAAMMEASTAAAVDAATAAVAEAPAADAMEVDEAVAAAAAVAEGEEDEEDKKLESKSKSVPLKKQIKSRKG